MRGKDGGAQSETGRVNEPQVSKDRSVKTARMIFHIVSRTEWEEANRAGIYTPATLRTEGFIHCSTIEQIVGTANLFFRGQNDLLILSIAEQRLASPLKFEAPAAPIRTDALFPHVYGSLNLNAVTGIHEFPCDEAGIFRLPLALRAEQ